MRAMCLGSCAHATDEQPADDPKRVPVINLAKAGARDDAPCRQRQQRVALWAGRQICRFLPNRVALSIE